MKQTAIIGTGIAGLGCAHFLHQQSELTLYEKNDYAGGHSNTVLIPEENRSLPVDTGFMVFNKVTYPNLTRLFRELGVAIKPAPMSFSVQHLPTGLEYSGTSLNHLFAQRKNLLRPRFWKMIRQINRFNLEAVNALNAPRYQNHTLGEYVRERNYGEDFLNFYLIPMSSAVWSTRPDLMLEFPAAPLLRFFHNHGFLGLHTQHPWFTVVNGAKAYVEKLTAPFRDKIHLRRAAASEQVGERRAVGPCSANSNINPTPPFCIPMPPSCPGTNCAGPRGTTAWRTARTAGLCPPPFIG